MQCAAKNLRHLRHLREKRKYTSVRDRFLAGVNYFSQIARISQIGAAKNS